jgi:hypothetical protein
MEEFPLYLLIMFWDTSSSEFLYVLPWLQWTTVVLGPAECLIITHSLVLMFQGVGVWGINEEPGTFSFPPCFEASFFQQGYLLRANVFPA